MINGNSAILGLKFKDKSIVRDIVEKLKNECIGLNTYKDGNDIVLRQDEIKVHEIPKNNMNIKDLTVWATYQYKPDLRKELGTLAANDDTIVINLNHAVSDGKYIVGVAEHIGDAPKKLDRKDMLPLPFEHEFGKELEERAKTPPYSFHDDQYNTMLRKLEGFPYKEEQVSEFICPTQSFANYNPAKKTCNGLTPAIITGLSLAINAFQDDEVIRVIGGSMAANMRNEMKYKPNLRHCNIFTVIPLGAPVTNFTTLNECFNRITKRLRKHFDEKGSLFDFGDSFVHYQPKFSINDQIMICFSHLGPINVKPLVEDLYLNNIDYDVPFSNSVPLLTYSINDPRTDRNEFHSQLRYYGNCIPKEHADILNKSLQYFLQNFNTNNTIGEALDQLKQFQKKLKK